MGIPSLTIEQLVSLIENCKKSINSANISLIHDIKNSHKVDPLDFMTANYRSSLSKLKLHYPEPYIASPSYIHSELFFLHILHYQFWLWYFFIFLVVFFFISFVVTVRWNQPSIRPRRETREVSRSKCGDLITALVPLSWAASIIVSGSTDATDITDGFSTGELVIGVRAYQWGWEYYYPRTRMLRHSEDSTSSNLIGNSTKYVSNSADSRNVEPLWHQFQKKIQSPIVTPAHLLALPSLPTSFKNFDSIGLGISKQQGAFAKVTANSKTFNSNLAYSHKNYSNAYYSVNNLLSLNDYNFESPLYGLKRQSSSTSLQSPLSNSSSFVDSAGRSRLLYPRPLSNPLTRDIEGLVSLESLESLTVASKNQTAAAFKLPTYLNEIPTKGVSSYGTSKTSSSSVNSLSKTLSVDESLNYGLDLPQVSSNAALNYPTSTKTFMPNTPNSKSSDGSFIQNEQSSRTYTGLDLSASDPNLLTPFPEDQLGSVQVDITSPCLVSRILWRMGSTVLWVLGKLPFPPQLKPQPAAQCQGLYPGDIDILGDLEVRHRAEMRERAELREREMYRNHVLGLPDRPRNPDEVILDNGRTFEEALEEVIEEIIEGRRVLPLQKDDERLLTMQKNEEKILIGNDILNHLLCNRVIFSKNNALNKNSILLNNDLLNYNNKILLFLRSEETPRTWFGSLCYSARWSYCHLTHRIGKAWTSKYNDWTGTPEPCFKSLFHHRNLTKARVLKREPLNPIEEGIYGYSHGNRGKKVWAQGESNWIMHERRGTTDGKLLWYGIRSELLPKVYLPRIAYMDIWAGDWVWVVSKRKLEFLVFSQWNETGYLDRLTGRINTARSHPSSELILRPKQPLSDGYSREDPDLEYIWEEEEEDESSEDSDT